MLPAYFAIPAITGTAPAYAPYSFPDCTSGPLAHTTVCDTSADPITRAEALIAMFTTNDLIRNTDNFSSGVPRLGLPEYDWWSEALHGVVSSPGVTFADSGNFSYATSFPAPILMSAAFDDAMIKEVATVISTEARAFNNAGRAGLDYFTPNINRQSPLPSAIHVGACDAISNFIDHKFVADLPHAAAAGIEAGTDIDCGSTYGKHLGAALSMGLVNVSDISGALTRQYASLIRLGYFDPADSQPYRQLGWTDVNTQDAQNLAYQSAVEGSVLLKNDGTLPLTKSIQKLAFIGPWANTTTQMQGNYAGIAPFLISPFAAARTAGFSATLTQGTDINSTDTSGFAAALAAAQAADAIVYAGGIDDSIEGETKDRKTITWPGNQLDLIAELAELGKPLVVMQFGGGQVDDAALKNNSKVNVILWGGLSRPEWRHGGDGHCKVSPAGRLPVTQYPANYVNEVPMTDMTLRPSATNPGRTYKWLTSAPTYEFGVGLSFTSFSLSFASTTPTSYDIQALVAAGSASAHLDLAPFDTFWVATANAGPAPFPNKELVSYVRLKGIRAGQQAMASLAVTLGSIARVDDTGSAWLYPGDYTLLVDVPTAITHNVRLTGTKAQITHWPTAPSS
ncbi:glycoside hydrolase family 3 C-terminal domain-containing protein [Mycena olivaceomarginata]|nr:glycoside hydrolase family 3 C-terminal domain-containing protein [Mycena olivaceomarginata]